MQISFDVFTMLFVGNISCLLLTISMLMTLMSTLRIVAIGSGISGGIYDYFWLNDPVGTFWEAAFTSVNLVQIMRIAYENVSVRLNQEERDFHAQFLSSLAPYQVRRVLGTGVWLDAEAGTPITSQGEMISHLIFLKSGTCDVLVDDVSIGRCNAGSMIGEISFRSGEGATATVLAREPVRYLALERNALQKLLKADAEISHAIEDISTHSLEFKLARMNRAAQRIGSNLMLIKCQSHGAISSTALP
jgi:CRP-like cAMP-binding protein